MDQAPVTFRLRYGRWLSAVTIAVALSGVGGLAATADVAAITRYVWPLLLLAVLAWALFWQPQLRIETQGLIVRNVFRTIELPWPAIERVDTKYALTLYTSIGVFSVWAAPAPGRHASSSATLGSVGFLPRRMLGVGGSIRPGDLPSSESGAAAYIIRQRYDELLEAGLIAGVEPGTARIRLHLPIIVSTAVLVVLSLLGAFLP